MDSWLARWLRRLRVRWWNFKTWLRGPWQSPLRLRQSYRILANSGSPRPLRDLLRLLLPFPPWPLISWHWQWHLPCALPDSPRFLRDNPALVAKRYEGTYELGLVPLWRWRDTPQRSLYRLYECFCAGDGTLVGYETEYFWKHREPTAWQTHLLDDPGEGQKGADDDDGGLGSLERRAVMAALVEDLVAAFNWRMEWGFRRRAPVVDRGEDGTPAPFVPHRCPDWVYTVPPLRETLVLSKMDPEDDDIISDDDPWKKRNIVCGVRGDLRTV